MMPLSMARMGETITVARLGDPMELNVRGYELSIRKAGAEMIEAV